MNKQDILNYFKNYGEDGRKFVQMLQEKVFFAKSHKTEVMAYHKMRTGKEIEEMLVIADDLFTEGKLQ